MADLIDRAALVAMIRTRASELADMAIEGLPENARNREAMEAALTALLPAIAALPAQGVRVPEVEERKFYHDAWPLAKLLEARDLGNGLLTDDGEAWRYRLTHSDARGKYDVLYRPTRKIAALAPAEAGGVEARDVLSGLSSYLGAGMSDDDTTAEEYERRIRWGIDYHVNATVQRCADVIEELSKQAYSGQSVPWGQIKSAVLAVATQAPAPVDALVKLLKEARDNIAEYVAADYPEEYRAQYPDMNRRYQRDMELCRRIDAALAAYRGVAK